MKAKSYGNMLIVIICILVIFSLHSNNSCAQLWKPLPPYNILWPLWSPVLSPKDPLTGLPTPLVSSLTDKTYLPVQPALVWDPSLPYFYLLYNYVPLDGTANQLLYFDPTEGAFSPVYSFKVWPPAYLLKPVTTTTYTGTVTSIVPAPLTLPTGYASLISFDPALWLNFWVPLVNPAYENLYGIYPSLLTASSILPASFVFSGSYTPAVI
ncbi:hypothetical protein JXL19_05110 [bacterium]|nr:hypothetical protein [bacterium]